MRQICSVCKKFYGFKEPFEDDSETHGFCDECYEIEMKVLNRMIEEMERGES